MIAMIRAVRRLIRSRVTSQCALARVQSRESCDCEALIRLLLVIRSKNREDFITITVQYIIDIEYHLYTTIGRYGLHWLILVTNAIKRFYLIKKGIVNTQFTPQSFDVAINCAIVKKYAFSISRIHQLIAVFNHSRA